MKWKIEVSYKSETPDAIGRDILQDIVDLAISGVKSVRTAQVYWIEGDLDSDAIETVCSELLADPITQNYIYRAIDAHATAQDGGSTASSDTWTVEVRFKPGVTDAVGDSVLKGIRDLGISSVRTAHTGQKYWIRGDLDRSKLQTIAQRLLANEVIQTFQISQGD